MNKEVRSDEEHESGNDEGSETGVVNHICACGCAKNVNEDYTKRCNHCGNYCDVTHFDASKDDCCNTCAINFDSFSKALGRSRSEDSKFEKALSKIGKKEPSLDFAHVCYENIQKAKGRGKTTTSKKIRKKITLTDLLEDFTSLAEEKVERRSTSEGRKEELIQWMHDTITTHSYYREYTKETANFNWQLPMMEVELKNFLTNGKTNRHPMGLCLIETLHKISRNLDPLEKKK